MIYIYSDGHHSISHVQMAIQAVTNNNVVFCTSSMIIEGCLDYAQLLIMPGGADLYFCEKLNGVGNQNIRNFVSKGGSYLGICAGAYYGCSTLDWACGKISGTRELGFYDGKATGPVFDWVENKKDIYNGSWMKAVEIEIPNAQKLLTQYNGGPVFEEVNGKVIARYTDLENNPPAVIEGEFGQGRYIVSSPHIENFGHLLTDGLYKHLNNSYNREKTEVDKLLGHEKAQKEFFKNIIDRLL